ncbi:MAG: hypothetical protein Q8O40_01415 [Chloroflexota bacterium]|nr:hypothetical protein [Chloroflexota bacterium]
MSDDELRQVFEAVAAGKSVQQLLRHRHRTTVYKIHNVVSQFQLRDLTTCDDSKAADIAKKAQYGATPGYVQALFLRWKAWKGSDSGHGNETQEGRPDMELGPHMRELFYFGQRLRDLASVPLPYEVVKATAEERDSAMWRPWPSGALAEPPQDREEAAVASAWGSWGYDARTHPLFPAFRQHLGDHRCWESLGRLEEAFRAYGEGCLGTYRAILKELQRRLPDIPGDGPGVMATPLLMDGLRRKQALAGLTLSCGLSGESGQDRYRVTYGAWSLSLGDEKQAQRMTSVLRESSSLPPIKAELDALAKTAEDADQARAEFQEALSPDALLRKLIIIGRCDWCP